MTSNDTTTPLSSWKPPRTLPRSSSYTCSTSGPLTHRAQGHHPGPLSLHDLHLTTSPRVSDLTTSRATPPGLCPELRTPVPQPPLMSPHRVQSSALAHCPGQKTCYLYPCCLARGCLEVPSASSTSTWSPLPGQGQEPLLGSLGPCMLPPLPLRDPPTPALQAQVLPTFLTSLCGILPQLLSFSVLSPWGPPYRREVCRLSWWTLPPCISTSACENREPCESVHCPFPTMGSAHSQCLSNECKKAWRNVKYLEKSSPSK
jgi:hypothetical protein